MEDDQYFSLSPLPETPLSLISLLCTLIENIQYHSLPKTVWLELSKVASDPPVSADTKPPQPSL